MAPASATQPSPALDLFGRPRTPHKYWTKDQVARDQEIDAFTTLQDGQPGAPGDWELHLTPGWVTAPHRPDVALLEPQVRYTPHRYGDFAAEFLESMQLRLRMPLELGAGRVAGNGALDFGWQHRWVRESDGLPTISTLAEVRIPSGVDSSGADGTFTTVLAKDVGPGIAYWNGWVRTASGDNMEDLRPFQWGLRGGYKWRIRPGVALLAVYDHQSSEQRGHGNLNMLELAAEFRSAHHLAFGPGVFVGLDERAETPNLGAGFRFVYTFNARSPPP